MSKDINLLYVDDEPINLQIFEFNFNNNYNIHTAESGADGLKRLEENNNIKIVISDMKMPEMSGIEFIRTAKEKYLNIICFILTGFDITPEISNALNNNLINKYFRKPFDLKEIDTAIQEAITQKVNNQ